MKYLILIIFSICTQSCSTQDLQSFHFLEGTWQVEGKQQFEKWDKFEDDLLGEGYKLVDGKKRIFEKLAIKEIRGRIIYQATVINQNEGATISFPLNDKLSAYYSFENLEHDFPKKIQYQKINETRIKVNVLGDNEQGFSYVMNKVTP
ncbi:hypothetical protein DF185_16960 [Marinifilum breve]|jgi:hypothetical protein|uniref:DUF6265 domain-containing protein n=1 Tax=Marinifilum breve TaxID=2184082 RepID=A0A2V3ZUD6_9BACT|nr:DUF6265 family protein [Marinifilum breve]PXX98021.1 hypothetical protein DF185_16960 [Marinifilum breve]